MRLILGAVLLCACAGKTVTEGAPDAAPIETGPARVPKVHRAVASACPSARGEGHPLEGGSCASDAECSAGRNGRCLAMLPSPSACSYDDCTFDGECGSGVCECRASATDVAPNRCFKGNCTIDADCGKEHCSPSGTDIFAAGCMGPGVGSFGYFCHGTSDECVDASDCSGDTRCLFDPERLHFRCFEVACPL